MTPRWYVLKYHKKQWELFNSQKRFVMADGGRRSGKTEIGGKRLAIRRALRFRSHTDGRFLFAAPVHQQAKDIYWKDLKSFIPKRFVRRISESELFIDLWWGTRLQVAGMDRPERAEGSPLDGIVMDEFANMKADVWSDHVRPALSTLGRPGWAIFVSVPEGRNHQFHLRQSAMLDIAENGDNSQWGIYHWKSSEVIDPVEVEAARRDLDKLTFEQEYEGSYVNFSGLAYYPFDRNIHARERVLYNPNRPLIFCFDFNRAPGICVVAQIHDYHALEPMHRPEVARSIIAVIGEVHIPSGSTTSAVCRRLILDWNETTKHEGDVYIYGDATGGAKKSSSNDGSDWDIVRDEFKGVRAWTIHNRVKRANPPERARVNAVNKMLMTTEGIVRILIDPVNAPRTIEDFEAVVVLEGGSGEINKDHDDKHTHLTDGFGYFVEVEFPTRDRKVVSHSLT